jgi:hypothetical protein
MIIDIFNHFMPSAIFDRLSALVPGHVALSAFPELPALWDVEARLRLLDEFDGLQQVLSLANPPIEALGPPAQTPEWRASPMTDWPRSAAPIPTASRPSSPRCR